MLYKKLKGKNYLSLDKNLQEIQMPYWTPNALYISG